MAARRRKANLEPATIMMYDPEYMEAPPGYGIHCLDAVGKRVLNGVIKAEKDERAARKSAREEARKVTRKGDPDAAEKTAEATLVATYELNLPGAALLYTVPARTATRHITGRSRLFHLTDLHIGVPQQ